MTYKTIMVCLNEVDRIERLLDFAIEIADHQNAHILGLYVIPAVQIYPSVTIDVSSSSFRCLSGVLQAPRAPCEELV